MRSIQLKFSAILVCLCNRFVNRSFQKFAKMELGSYKPPCAVPLLEYLGLLLTLVGSDVEFSLSYE